MVSFLTENIKEDFYIKLYFNIDEGFETAGLRRAYLDFSRTLFKKDKINIQANETDEERNKKRNETEIHLLCVLKEIINTNFSSQKEFDIKHREIVSELTQYWCKLTIGQAQKWINMTLKYWLLFGEKRIKGIDKNAQFFHIPIDSYVQKGMFNETNPKPWSKINDYDTYMNYQITHRKKSPRNIPLHDEFLFFNKYLSKK